MSEKILSGTGVPSAAVFHGHDGTPIYIDLATGLAYFLDETNTVTEIAASGAGLTNLDGGTPGSTYGAVTAIDAGGP